MKYNNEFMNNHKKLKCLKLNLKKKQIFKFKLKTFLHVMKFKIELLMIYKIKICKYSNLVHF